MLILSYSTIDQTFRLTLGRSGFKNANRFLRRLILLAELAPNESLEENCLRREKPHCGHNDRGCSFIGRGRRPSAINRSRSLGPKRYSLLITTLFLTRTHQTEFRAVPAKTNAYDMRVKCASTVRAANFHPLLVVGTLIRI